MDTIEVSFIVAIYNIEQYVEKCILSISNIARNDIEIILVDDGSTDSSGYICDQLALKDSRIKVIHQINKGLPEARNSGLKASRGKWITFVDGDDFLSRDFEKDILACVDEKDELVFFGYKAFSNDEDLVQKQFARKKMILLSEREISLLRLAIMNNNIEKQTEFYINTIVYTSTWGKLYKRKFILDNELDFITDVSWGEDVVFTYRVLKCAKSIKTIESIGYCYRVQIQSMTQKYDEKAIDKYLKFMYAMKDIVQDDVKCMEAFWTMAAKQYLTIVRRSVFNNQNPKSLKQRKEEYKKSKSFELIKLAFDNADLKKYNFVIRIGAILCKYDRFYLLMLLYKIQRIKDYIKYGI